MIEIEQKELPRIRQDIKDILQEDEEEKGLEIRPKDRDKIINLIDNSQLSTIFNRTKKRKFIEGFDYETLADVYDRIENLQEHVRTIKENVELEKFFRKGKIFDFQKLSKKAKQKELHKRFPKFSIRRLKQLVENPMLEIENYAGERIKYDPFVVKKINIAIIQMIFNEMDLYVANAGAEGSGKSCWSSQLLLYFYTFLKEVGLIDYAYKIEQLFFSSIESILDAQEEQANTDYFRIMTLDEAYDLNRQNFREETSMLYKDDMRSARKLQRINQLNLPQIGELDTSITLSRTNFIFDCRMDNEVKTGTLKKGFIDMYILPRGSKVYSPFHRREMNRREVKEALSKQLEKKSDYYMEMPKELIIHRFPFEDKWGFDREEYSKHIKSENKRKRYNKSQVKTTEQIAYILFKKLPDVRHWGTFDMKNKTDKRMYNTLKAWEKHVKNRFYEDPDKLKRFDLLYKEK